MNPIARRFALAAAAAMTTFALLPVGPAYAADEATIDASETKDGVIQMLVSVPGEDAIDLASVAVSIDGTKVNATATSSDETDAIQRTTVLAIDTSFSMRGERINGAKRAALAFLDGVPANVRVGIVTFDVGFDVVQRPSQNREASRAVIDGLELGADTALYEGVAGAIDATGTSGQRQVLVLSDGRDSTDATLPPVIAKISKSDVKVDVVALDQGTEPPQPLVDMAAAGNGTVVAADAGDLETVFSDQAESISRQVLVSAEVPASQTKPDANITVSLESGDQTYETSALLSVAGAIKAGGPAQTTVLTAADDGSFDIPKEVMYGAIAALGLGVIVLLATVMAGGGSDRRPSLAAQLDVYGATASSSATARAKAAQASSDFSGLAQQARAAAENVLQSNKGFEAKVADRLEGAGMALKASEWLLLHLGIAFLAGLLGLLLTGGNPVGLILFLFLGAIGPWLYLSVKRSRRLKAFDANLADTLQLMAGSLSAGLSLAQSMDTIVREGTEPITSEFKRVIAETRLGVPIEDALDGIAIRMQSKDFTWVVMAIRIQREVGGNLAELLIKVAGTLREREYIRRHVSALSAEGRLSCWILGGLPPAFLGYLSLTKPDYVSPLYTEPMGWLMLIGMAILLTVGIFWMSKVAKVEI